MRRLPVLRNSATAEGGEERGPTLKGGDGWPCPSSQNGFFFGTSPVWKHGVLHLKKPENAAWKADPPGTWRRPAVLDEVVMGI